MKPEREGIVAVADDPDVLMIVKAVLQAKGYRVFLAGSAVAALDVLKLKLPGVASVLICAGIADSSRLEEACREMRIQAHFMSGFVEEGIVRCRIPELESAHPPAAAPMRHWRAACESAPSSAL